MEERYKAPRCHDASFGDSLGMGNIEESFGATDFQWRQSDRPAPGNTRAPWYI
jgi:hypothetical protein